jgi:hypothetical protein
MEKRSIRQEVRLFNERRHGTSVSDPLVQDEELEELRLEAFSSFPRWTKITVGYYYYCLRSCQLSSPLER